jgi:hypothetical protein
MTRLTRSSWRNLSLPLPLLLLLMIVVAISLGFLACGDDDDDNDDNGEPGEFVFATTAPASYVRVDRMGMPAVATAVITSKNAYNAANPVDDAAGNFVGEITTNVTALHTALDDDLTGLGLTPCQAANCVNAAAPLVVPDVIKINSAEAAGFPNGRRLADQVIDVTLAVILLDLTVHSATTLASVPVNPPANDVPFLTAFPYLAQPNAF